MNQEHDPLPTAEDVQRAFAEGRQVEFAYRDSDEWHPIALPITPGAVALMLRHGRRFRAPAKPTVDAIVDTPAKPKGAVCEFCDNVVDPDYGHVGEPCRVPAPPKDDATHKEAEDWRKLYEPDEYEDAFKGRDATQRYKMVPGDGSAVMVPYADGEWVRYSDCAAPTHKGSEDGRAAFEAWYRNGNSADSVPLRRYPDGRYYDDIVEMRWAAWLAALSAHAVPAGVNEQAVGDGERAWIVGKLRDIACIYRAPTPAERGAISFAADKLRDYINAEAAQAVPAADAAVAALRQIAALDYRYAATNGCAYQAVHTAKAALDALASAPAAPDFAEINPTDNPATRKWARDVLSKPLDISTVVEVSPKALAASAPAAPADASLRERAAKARDDVAEMLRLRDSRVPSMAQMREWIATLDALVAQPCSAPAAPDWVLVPREATWPMLVAHWQFGSDEPIDQSLLTDGDLAAFQSEWRDIIGAAQAVPAAGELESARAELREACAELLAHPVMAASAPAAPDALALAIRFHDTYERLAPSFGYETRKDTRAFDPESANGRLMVAVCGELMSAPAAPVSEADCPDCTDSGTDGMPPVCPRHFGEVCDQLANPPAAKAEGVTTTPAELRGLTSLLMCSDPWPVENAGEGDFRDEVVSLVNRLAQAAGYGDWLDVFHDTTPLRILAATPKGQAADTEGNP